jgi:hypothetical protein
MGINTYENLNDEKSEVHGVFNRNVIKRCLFMN